MRKRAFSLIELLVVVAVVLVLVALFFHSYGRFLTRAETAVCQANQRYYFAAFAAYRGDNDGYLPPYPDIVTPAGDGTVRWTRDENGLGTYLDSFPECPRKTTGGWGRGHFGYGVNQNLLRDWGNPDHVLGSRLHPASAGIGMSGERVMFFRCHYGLSFHAPTHLDRTVYAVEMFGSPYGTPQYHGYDAFGQRQLNFLFVDGRVETIGRGRTTWVSSNAEADAPFQDGNRVPGRYGGPRMRRQADDRLCKPEIVISGN